MTPERLAEIEQILKQASSGPGAYAIFPVEAVWGLLAALREAEQRVKALEKECGWASEFMDEPDWFPNEGDRQAWLERRAALRGGGTAVQQRCQHDNWRARLLMVEKERDALQQRVEALEKVIHDLMRAAGTLMDEVTGQRATKWGVVNAAMVAGEAALRGGETG